MNRSRPGRIYVKNDSGGYKEVHRGFEYSNKNKENESILEIEQGLNKFVASIRKTKLNTYSLFSTDHTQINWST